MRSELILRTVLYSSLFDYPLTISELRENLQGLEMEESEILEAYKSSHALNSAIDYHDGYFCPEGRIELIELRQWRQAHSQRILRANWWLLKLICCICQVTGTFTTLGDVLFYDPSPVSKNAGSGGT